MHRFTPRKPDSNWSETNKERVARLLEENLIEPAGLTLIEAAQRSGRWDVTGRENVDLSMPVELESALDKNEKAATFFRSLAPSYKRQFVAWIATAKRPETRAKRLAETIRLLQAGKKLGMR